MIIYVNGQGSLILPSSSSNTHLFTLYGCVQNISQWRQDFPYLGASLTQKWHAGGTPLDEKLGGVSSEIGKASPN